MKKCLSLFLSFVMVLSLCSSAFAETTEITYWSSTIMETPEGTYEQSIIDEFNALNNGIHVNVVSCAAADLTTKLTAAATTSDLPDFVMGTPAVFSSLRDLEAVVPAEEAIDPEFFGSFMEICRNAFVDDAGLHYGVPYFMNPYAVVYRMDIFEEKGIAIPTTWDEFVEVCKKLTDDEHYGMAMVGVRNSSGEARFQYLARMFGVQEFYQENGEWKTDLSGEKFAKALKSFTDLNLVHGVCQPGALETAYPDAVKLLSSGTCALLITGSNAIGAITKQAPELNGKLGSFKLPTDEDGAIAYSGFGIFVTNPDTAKHAAINEYLKFWFSTEHQIEFSALSGRLPTLTSAYADPAIESIDSIKGYISSLDLLVYSPTIPGYSEINDIYGEAYSMVLAGEATVEEACAAAAERAEAIVADANDL